MKSFHWRKIVSAIHLRSLSALLQIVLNIELFIPFGFLYRMMPSCSKKQRVLHVGCSIHFVLIVCGIDPMEIEVRFV